MILNDNIFELFQKIFNVIQTYANGLYNALFHEFSFLGFDFYLWEGLGIVSGITLVGIWLAKALL